MGESSYIKALNDVIFGLKTTLLLFHDFWLIRFLDKFDLI